jgi:LmbE family N-acetylglucosaminyl deacetylase
VPDPTLDLLVISPHLDDAVLSCGGRLAATTAGGGTARVVTVFAGDEPAAPVHPLAARLREIWQLPEGAVVAARRAEDEAACALVGAGTEHWEFAEALYRSSADGAALYPTIPALYGEPAPDDDDLRRELAARIAALPPARRILAPLAVGGHVDHRLVRGAAEAAGRDPAFYEEFPYSEWKWFAVDRALGRRRDWAPEAIALDAGLLERKREAILAYRSQIPALFRTGGRLGKQLRRHARRAGGERVWRRLSPADGDAR